MYRGYVDVKVALQHSKSVGERCLDWWPTTVLRIQRRHCLADRCCKIGICYTKASASDLACCTGCESIGARPLHNSTAILWGPSGQLNLMRARWEIQLQYVLWCTVCRRTLWLQQ
jgi:hypothetical protein